jgi:hypothetical protein
MLDNPILFAIIIWAAIESIYFVVEKIKNKNEDD